MAETSELTHQAFEDIVGEVLVQARRMGLPYALKFFDWPAPRRRRHRLARSWDGREVIYVRREGRTATAVMSDVFRSIVSRRAGLDPIERATKIRVLRDLAHRRGIAC
jgi:hypothetical protein